MRGDSVLAFILGIASKRNALAWKMVTMGNLLVRDVDDFLQRNLRASLRAGKGAGSVVFPFDFYLHFEYFGVCFVFAHSMQFQLCAVRLVGVFRPNHCL